jgi:hypothetical protein
LKSHRAEQTETTPLPPLKRPVWRVALLVIVGLAWLHPVSAHAYETVIINEFNGFKYGNIYILQNGLAMVQHEVTTWELKRGGPIKAIVYDDNGLKIKVEGIDNPVGVAPIDGAYESLIADTFTGFKRGNVYRLRNGQVWEQTEDYTLELSIFQPKVIAYNDGRWYLQVEGVKRPVGVKRILEW